MVTPRENERMFPRGRPSATATKRQAEGFIVAIVGADGAGKTTAINGLVQRLALNVETVRVHMGIPNRSAITWMVRGLLKLVRQLFKRPFMRKEAETPLYTDQPAFPGYGWLIYQACMAFDRYHSFLHVKREAGNGKLVLCDRYPLRQITLADGPQIRRVTASTRRNLAIRLLMKLEEACYRWIQTPDLICVLDIDPDVAVERKRRMNSHETRAQIEGCVEEIRHVDWNDLPACIIDASMAIENVITEIEEAICLQLLWRLEPEPVL